MESMLKYRRRNDSEKWHFCSNCSGWPAADYIEIHHPEHLLKGSLCLECVTKRHYHNGVMEYSPSHLASVPPQKKQA